MPKSWFLERAEYDFEGHKFYGTKDYDGFLKYSYNDYMTPLPVEKRQPHALVSSFDFNVKSKNVKEKMQNNKGICENTANTETGNSHTILISPIGF